MILLKSESGERGLVMWKYLLILTILTLSLPIFLLVSGKQHGLQASLVPPLIWKGLPLGALPPTNQEQEKFCNPNYVYQWWETPQVTQCVGIPPENDCSDGGATEWHTEWKDRCSKFI